MPKSFSEEIWEATWQKGGNRHAHKDGIEHFWRHIMDVGHHFGAHCILKGFPNPPVLASESAVLDLSEFFVASIDAPLNLAHFSIEK